MTQKENWNCACELYLLGEISKDCYKIQCSQNHVTCFIYKEIVSSPEDKSHLEKLVQLIE